MNSLNPGSEMQLGGQWPRIEGEGALSAQRRLDRSTGAEESSFKDMLQGIVSQVDTLQKDADASIRGLVNGETQNIHDVTVKMEEADVAFDLMMQVRNKLMEAYQELIKTQV